MLLMLTILPPPTFEHARQHRSCRVERPGQVHLHVVVPGRRLEAERAPDLIEDARVVHEDVDAAAAPDRLLHRGVDHGALRHITCERNNLGSVGIPQFETRRFLVDGDDPRAVVADAVTMARPRPPAAPVTSATVTRRCLRGATGVMRSPRSRRLPCRCPRR